MPDDHMAGISRRVALGLLLAQGLAFAVWMHQNSGAPRLGGPISPVKAMWLVYAISLWLILPCGVAAERSFGRGMAGRLFQVLAVSMLLRGAAESYLCLVGSWRVPHGLAHDCFHAGLVVCGMALLAQEKERALNTVPFTVLGLTLAALVTELVFVRWFVAATGGPARGIYFVPGGAAFRSLNIRTAVLFLPQYLVFLGLLVRTLLGRGRCERCD